MWLAIFLFLTHSAVAGDCQAVNTPEIAEAKLYQCENLHVLYLRGEPKARALAMGELIKNGALSPEVLNYFSGKVTSVVHEKVSFLAHFVELLYNQIVRLLHRATPPELSEEVNAMAMGLGIEPINLRRALSLPDAAALTNVVGSIPLFRALPAAGCTSVAWKNKAGSLFYGRNLDFAGTGIWDRHPLLTVILPADKQEQKHIVFGADGALFGGITGVNESGIGFAVHQNYSSRGSLYGVPVMFIGELVLRQAKSIDEALAIVKANRPAVLWTFVITNFATGEAVAVEASPTRFAPRAMENNAFVQTNHAMDANVREDEFVSLGIKMNSIYRMKRAFEILDAMPDSAQPLADINGILAYQENPEGRMIAYHDILKAHTIQTVLLEADQNKLNKVYLSIDPAPTSGGRMAGFDPAMLWEGQVPKYELADFAKTPPAKRERQRQISDAFSLYFDQHALSEASAMLTDHNTLDSAYFTAVTLTQRGLWQESLLTAEQALQNPRFLGEPAYIRQSLEWIRAASLLELGRKKAAVTAAADILAEKPENIRLRDFAEQLSRGTTPPKFMRRFSFDFFSGDLHGRAN
ncbi:MAG: C45 family autoproteolytic acyltransferase/hydrolase [Bdellovibrionota bacterium]